MGIEDSRFDDYLKYNKNKSLHNNVDVNNIKHIS